MYKSTFSVLVPFGKDPFSGTCLEGESDFDSTFPAWLQPITYLLFLLFCLTHTELGGRKHSSQTASTLPVHSWPQKVITLIHKFPFL